MLSIVSPYSGLLSALRHWWAYHTPPIEFSGISSCALLLGVGGQYLLNNIWPFSRIWNQKKQGERSIEIYGSQLEKLLYRSIVENKRVMVTLKNEKFYIGRVAISLTPQQDRDLLILPSQSGYRDHKHRVMLTTDYDQTYRVIKETEENYLDIISDFGMAIPIPEVITASLYHTDIHAKYFVHEDPPDSTAKELPPSKETLTARDHLKDQPKDRIG